MDIESQIIEQIKHNLKPRRQFVNLLCRDATLEITESKTR